VRDAVKVDRHAEAPYPAAIKVAANSNELASADTPAVAVAPEATDGQEG
jgi:large subunit ribosomal protein L3